MTEAPTKTKTETFYNPSALMSAYNYAKAWARRTGLTTTDRVDRAFGYLMSGEAAEKWSEYGTDGKGRSWTCLCPDRQYRGSLCKHILSAMIDRKHDDLLESEGLR